MLLFHNKSIGTVTPCNTDIVARINDWLDDLFPLNQIAASEKLSIMHSLFILIE